MKSTNASEVSLLRRRTSLTFSLLLVVLIWTLGAIAAAAQTQIVYCASDDGRRHTCVADTRSGVRLLQRKSDNACVEGRSWGFSRGFIWVDRGCRADFEVGDRNAGRGDRDRDRDRDREGDRDRDRDRDRGGRNGHGSVTWQGKVPHDVKLVVYGSRLDFYVLSGRDAGPGRYNFNGSMPRDAVITVRRLRGRNDVYVVEQPSRRNDYKGAVRITDSRGGDDDSEIEISW